MRRLTAALVALISLSSVCYAAFAIFQTASGALSPAAVTCDITTGNCTGTGGGTSLFTAATCNDVDDAAAFTSFNNWAVNTWQAGNTGLIQLNVPAGKICRFAGVGNCGNGSSCPGKDIKQFRVYAPGASFRCNGTTDRCLFLGAYIALNQDTSHSARTASSSAGATCVDLLDPSKSSLFTAGNYALMTGIDQQRNGFPINPYYYEWPVIQSVSGSLNCAGGAGGSVHFTAPLANKYLSTWPVFSVGSAFEIDQGGPATLYVLETAWNTDQEYVGLPGQAFVIDSPGAQTYAIGRNISYTDTSFTGAHCGVPTQNMNFSVLRGDWSTCTIEIDKVIGTITYNGITLNRVNVQSSSVQQLNLINSTVGDLNGTPIKTTCSGSTLANLTVGVTSFGRTSEVDMGNCAINGGMRPNPVADNGNGFGTGGINGPGFNFTREMSGGVIKIANTVTITNAVDLGGGVLRLTVACQSIYPTCTNATTAFTVGLVYELASLNIGANFTGSTSGTTLTVSAVASGLLQSGATLDGSGVTGGSAIGAQLTGTGGAACPDVTCNGTTGTYAIAPSQILTSRSLTSFNTFFGNYQLAAKNSGASTIDINLNVGGRAYVSSGNIGGAMAAAWTTPGTNVAWQGQFGIESSYWQVTALTQDGHWLNVATTLAGGFPTIPTNTCPTTGACFSATVHPSPVFKCPSCTGNNTALAFGLDPAQGPYGSYHKRTYNASTIPNYTGTISSPTTTLVVSAVANGTLYIGLEVDGSGISSNSMTITGQISGTPGGVGSYTVNNRNNTTFTNNALSSTNLPVFGNLSLAEWNVTAASSGGGTFTYDFNPPFGAFVINSGGTGTPRWLPQVNAKNVGLRQVTLAGSSCVSGTCTGDTGMAIPDATFSQIVALSGVYSAAIAGSAVSATVTVKTNQGVVYPPVYP